MKRLNKLLALSVAAVLAIAANAPAATLLTSYTATGLDGRAAQADFYNDGGNLRIDVSNTGNPATVLDGTYIITSFWFNLQGAPSLNYISATALNTVSGFVDPNNTAVLGGSADTTANWLLPTTFASGFSYGVGTAGNPGGGGSFGPGAQGFGDGILPAGSTYPVINNGTEGQVPFAVPTVSFLFSFANPYTLTSASIGSSVTFGYGTSTNEGSVTNHISELPPVPVPLPAAAWSGMALLGGLGVTRKIRKHFAR